MLRATFHLTYRLARRIVVAIVGTSVVLLGVAMIFLPGPAVLVIPAGLAILGLEFAWARHWLKAIRTRTSQAIDSYHRRRSASSSATADRGDHDGSGPKSPSRGTDDA